MILQDTLSTVDIKCLSSLDLTRLMKTIEILFLYFCVRLAMCLGDFKDCRLVGWQPVLNLRHLSILTRRAMKSPFFHFHYATLDRGHKMKFPCPRKVYRMAADFNMEWTESSPCYESSLRSEHSLLLRGCPPPICCYYTSGYLVFYWPIFPAGVWMRTSTFAIVLFSEWKKSQLVLRSVLVRADTTQVERVKLQSNSKLLFASLETT